MKKLLIATVLLFSALSSQVMAEERMFTIVNHQFEGTKQWLPGTLIVNEGDDVTIKLINNAPSGVHNFSIPAFDVSENVLKGKTKTIKFKASKKGIHNIKCGLHAAHVGGQFIVM